MRQTFGFIAAFLLLPAIGFAHDWHRHNQHSQDDGHYVTLDISRSVPNADNILSVGAAESKVPAAWRFAAMMNHVVTTTTKPVIARHFEHFKNVKVRWDSDLLYVESNGLPDHNMMVGIRAWQQQVPLPQPFSGNNCWKIPLHPKLARTPINAKQTSFRGAIALAVNGVPIFSALNNRGVDAYRAGELDKWGGHCGRGDDYHYHIAPTHLQEIVGKGNPIAFALDGFPIYGLTEADGSPVGKLDELNGQIDASGNYHYHATKTYPYINGGVRGVVDFRNGEIASQPRDSPVRPGQPPLRDAKITGFETVGDRSVLTYEVRGRKAQIAYSPAGEDAFRFTYTDTSGRTRTETYQRRGRPDDRRRPGPPPPRPRR